MLIDNALTWETLEEDNADSYVMGEEKSNIYPNVGGLALNALRAI